MTFNKVYNWTWNFKNSDKDKVTVKRTATVHYSPEIAITHMMLMFDPLEMGNIWFKGAVQIISFILFKI